MLEKTETASKNNATSLNHSAAEQSFWLPANKQASYTEYASYRNVTLVHPGYPNDLPYGMLPHLNLREASLSNSDLRWKNFRGASFQRANLGGALLWGASFVNADLTHADLRHADFTGSDLAGADLSNAKTDGACFLGARYNRNTRFPEGFGDPHMKGLMGLQESLLQLHCN
jgi:uncharacterized protein YjbI with pentapeptide repeats